MNGARHRNTMRAVFLEPVDEPRPPPVASAPPPVVWRPLPRLPPLDDTGIELDDTGIDTLRPAMTRPKIAQPCSAEVMYASGQIDTR